MISIFTADRWSLKLRVISNENGGKLICFYLLFFNTNIWIKFKNVVQRWFLSMCKYFCHCWQNMITDWSEINIDWNRHSEFKMSRLKYEIKSKLDRLNEDLKSWLKQVDYALRLWSRLPETTLHDTYDQILTLMYRKLVGIT